MVKISGIIAAMDPEVSASDYGEIEKLIASKDSPVGIDAKRTPLILIQTLLQLEERLERLEGLVAGGDT